MARGILAAATALPRRRKAAAQIVAELGIDPAFADKLGVIEKPVAVDDDEHPSDFCARAASIALRAMGAGPADVGLVLSTCVSAEYMPSWTNAVAVVGKLGAARAVGFDVQLGCAATVAALAIARDRKDDGGPPLAIVVSAERWSHTLSKDAPFPPALLAHADGGAAVVVGEGAALTLGAHAISLEPEYNDYLITPAGGTREPTTAQTVEAHRHFRTAVRHQEGKTLVERYVRGYRRVIGEVLARVPEGRRAIDALIMNQVRPTMRAQVQSALDVPPTKTVSSYERFGHLGGADMFVGVELAARTGKLARGTAILAASSLPAFGAIEVDCNATQGSSSQRTSVVPIAVSQDSAVAALVG